MYRISIKKIDPHNIELSIDKQEYVPHRTEVTLVSKCRVNFEPGVTSYKPIPPETSFGAFPEEIDRQVGNIIRSYHAGMNGEDGFSWI